MSYITTLEKQQDQKKIEDIYNKIKVMKPVNNQIHIFLIKYLWNVQFKLDKLLEHINTYMNNNICILIYGDNYYKILEPTYYNETNKSIIEEYLSCVFKKINPYNNLTYDYTQMCTLICSEMKSTHNIFIKI
jgi:hypothetical protein